MNRSSLSPSHDRPVATHNAAETTPRASQSDAGGLGEVCASAHTPTGRVHGETYRAAFGGPLASRELWVGRSCSSRCLPSLCGLVTRVRGRIPFGASCPKRSLAREASTLSLATCPPGFPGVVLIPLGRLPNVPDTPLGSRRLVVSPPASTSWTRPGSSPK